MKDDVATSPRLARLPVFYGWIIVAIAFVTMAIGVNVRTAFSLLVPPITDEFNWDRGIVAGAFSFGFLVSALVGPFAGRLMDVKGPRFVVGAGVVLTVAGLGLGSLIGAAWQFYLTLGLLIGVGANLLGYGVHSQFLPNWFVRRRGLAIGIAFSGVGIGSIVLLPWMQAVIVREGWRSACLLLAAITAVILLPLLLLLHKKPQDIGLEPDGQTSSADEPARPSNVVDPVWTAVDWTLARAMRSQRFWWVALGYFCGLYAWYAVQVHQTKYLLEVGVSPAEAAWALGLVALFGVPGQIVFGHLSDRVGREWAWAIGCLGFAICYLALIALSAGASPVLLYTMVLTQGFLGYAYTPVLGPIVAEIFEGKSYGTVFGTLMLAAVVGGAAGPWVSGLIYDRTGSYTIAFWIALAACLVSAYAIYMASPRKVRLVAGRVPKTEIRMLPGSEYAKVALPVDYPPSRDFKPRWGYTHPPIESLYSWFMGHADEYRAFLADMRTLGAELKDIPHAFNVNDQSAACWTGIAINPIDTLALYAFVRKYRPALYLEIGSGATTCFAHAARKNGGLSTRIVSIDPEPRAGIDGICDEVIREGLETCDLAVFDRLQPGDILFMDGSHRTFMNSDVTVFFIDVLPRLKPGVIVHLHDIRLPYDYEPFFRDWYWNEQYMLAVYLMGNRERIVPLLPTALLTLDPAFANEIAAPLVQTPHDLIWYGGGSMWFTHR